MPAGHLLALFAAQDIGSDRLELCGSLPMAEYLALHGEIDLFLESLPWTGHTTALHSLWLGVPTVSVRGSHHAGRFGEMVLRNLGLEDFVAASVQDYPGLVAGLLAQPGLLADLRRSLRDRLLRSPLCDHAGFSARFGQASRRMWQNWLDGGVEASAIG